MCYSKEFKEASISIFNHLHKEKYSCNEIKNIFKNEYKNFPSLSSIYVWIQEIYIDPKKNEKNNKSYKKYRNTNITEEIETFIVSNAHLNINKIKKLVLEKFNKSFSLPTIRYIFKNNNLSYKKVYRKVMPYTDEKLKEKKVNLKEQLDNYKECHIIAIDEMGSYTGETSPKQWSPKGKQHFTLVKKIKGVRYSICAAMSNKKLIHYKITKGSFNGNLFNEFIMELVKKVNIEKKCLFMDNASIHKNKVLYEYVKDNKINMIYNIPYMSIYNPIEFVNNMIRNRLHNNKFETEEDLHNILREFQNEDNCDKFKNMYKHCLQLLNTNK